jgi:tRNA(Ile)-lysidine synthase
MQNIYQRFISNTKIFEDKKHLLVAVSGGADSVVLLNLVARFTHQDSEYSFSIAHCNFKLRGESSFRDAGFVKDLARFYEVPLYYTEFETTQYASAHGISVEMAARELRYDFFEKILDAVDDSICLLAHHKNDNVETFFLNLLRGTGIKGLRGMTVRSGRYVRPLLNCTKSEILEYAADERVNYVEDETNSDTVFLRNNIRHNVVPLLQTLNPQATEHIVGTMQTLGRVEKILDKWFDETARHCGYDKGFPITLSIEKLKTTPQSEFFLEMLLQPYNFPRSIISQIAESITGGTAGKVFYSSTHTVRRERDTIVIEEAAQSGEESDSFTNIPPILDYSRQFFANINEVPKDSAVAVIAIDKITEPLILRKWKEGDFFYPLGMSKKQKLSDFFNNNKFSSVQKSNTWVLTHKDDIVWIAGYRIDDRYKLRFPKGAGVEAIVVNVKT